MNLAEIIKQSQFTVLLGKNGSGKSTMLRRMNQEDRAKTKYISPERGGVLKYASNIEDNISSNPNWLDDTRRRNRFEQFREQSVTQFRNLELLILREIEKETEKRSDFGYTFDTILEQINNLLPVIKLIRADRGFSVSNKNGQLISEENMSSGESELVALAIEVLVFSRLSIENKILLLDEPDVHLHPDLQNKFINFIETIALEKNFKIVIATHSTAIISSFKSRANLQIVPIQNKEQTDFQSFSYNNIIGSLLPIFGAHPLSSVFNQSPLILVEGDDDKRILEQVSRSSQAKITLSPCVVGTISAMTEWENWLNTFMPSIYDSPVAYSLRDLDSSNQADIENNGVVVRIRINCYAIENILLTDDCLNLNSHTEDTFIASLKTWANSYPEHQYKDEIQFLIENFENRRTIKIKNIRNIIVALLGTSKPWEILVGHTIFNSCGNLAPVSPNSTRNYLGEKIYSTILMQ